MDATTWNKCEFGCVRQDSDGNWWILNSRRRGWSSFGYLFPSLDDLERGKHVRVLRDVSMQDETGTYFEFEKNMDHWSA